VYAGGVSFESALIERFGGLARRDVPLAAFTTFRVGGPADWLLELRATGDLVDAVRLARGHDVACTLLGGGSNVVIGDRGVRGLVIRLRGGDIVLQDPDALRADAGTPINGLVRWTVAHGVAGLEAWAGTPGTVGGAIHGNAHFRGAMIGDTVRSVCVLGPDGQVRDVPAAAMGFGYDRSRLQQSGEVLLSATFRVSRGDPAALRGTARASLAFRKRTQPLHLPSAGCVFQNPDPDRDAVPPGVPWSAGALIDRAGLKGARVGGALVSDIHANFLVNTGGATAADILDLADLVERGVRDRFGVVLRREIVVLGER
jgi:UDP-N-acetylmuramate dehydrogenase